MFVINPHGHFFVIRADEVEIDPSALIDCDLFDTEQAMMEAVCRTQDLDMDEIEGMAMVIMRSRITGEPVCVEDRGAVETIEGDVAQYVRDYEM